MSKECLKEFFKICYNKECTENQFKVFCDLLKELSEKDYAVILDYCSFAGTNKEIIESVAKKYQVSDDVISETIKRVRITMHHPVRMSKIFG